MQRATINQKLRVSCCLCIYFSNLLSDLFLPVFSKFCCACFVSFFDRKQHKTHAQRWRPTTTTAKPANVMSKDERKYVLRLSATPPKLRERDEIRVGRQRWKKQAKIFRRVTCSFIASGERCVAIQWQESAAPPAASPVVIVRHQASVELYRIEHLQSHFNLLYVSKSRCNSLNCALSASIRDWLYIWG